MIDDTLLQGLRGIGMSEYEGKVYAILSALRVASAREIHEQTKIPRGKVYETLAALAEKGFIVSSGTTPVRYSPVEATQTFERLKRESVTSLASLHKRLKALESESPEPLMQGYKLCTDWTRDSQIRMMLRRAKSEIIVICNDADSLSRYGKEIDRAAKQVSLYLVVGDENLAESAPVKCYTGGNDLIASFFRNNDTDTSGLVLKLSLIADSRESLSILEDEGRLTGIFICPDIYAGYLSRKIIEEIRPVPKRK